MSEGKFMLTTWWAFVLIGLFGVLLKDHDAATALIMLSAAGLVFIVGWFILYIRDDNDIRDRRPATMRQDHD